MYAIAVNPISSARLFYTWYHAYLLKVYNGGDADETSSAQLHVQLGPGKHFGELGMLFRQPRTCTVQSASYTEVLVISRATYMKCTSDPDFMVTT
jgi:CRP-like cAMP-binding protein